MNARLRVERACAVLRWPLIDFARNLAPGITVAWNEPMLKIMHVRPNGVYEAIAWTDIPTLELAATLSDAGVVDIGPCPGCWDPAIVDLSAMDLVVDAPTSMWEAGLSQHTRITATGPSLLGFHGHSAMLRGSTVHLGGRYLLVAQVETVRTRRESSPPVLGLGGRPVALHNEPIVSITMLVQPACTRCAPRPGDRPSGRHVVSVSEATVRAARHDCDHSATDVHRENDAGGRCLREFQRGLTWTMNSDGCSPTCWVDCPSCGRTSVLSSDPRGTDGDEGAREALSRLAAEWREHLPVLADWMHEAGAFASPDAALGLRDWDHQRAEDQDRSLAAYVGEHAHSFGVGTCPHVPRPLAECPALPGWIDAMLEGEGVNYFALAARVMDMHNGDARAHDEVSP